MREISRAGCGVGRNDLTNAALARWSLGGAHGILKIMIENKRARFDAQEKYPEDWIIRFLGK
ncbi:MAG: hypothetical protein BWX84_02070 [Verrucomicrobia bacterium ADurb.Bin118]|jgi:hypothetical protein|nr:MAG: hypothetical protein BWX84_02070 [Verrucomicrobia bacterium ADurb.Bin118]